MASETTCLKCGAPLTGDARQGFCPKCLFAQAVASGFDEPSVSGPFDSKVEADAARQELPRTFGDYELLEEVARGGMGIVYRARHVCLDRIVAVKMLLFGPLSSPEFVKRFRAEASAAASLLHPNIVAIHEVGVHRGQQYFAMDYVEGQSLAKLLANGPLPASRAAGYLKTIAEAIHYAHERGILHRDLKPSNVLIDANDQPRVTDFGLARRLEGDSELTVTGQVLGSPNYMPPEQAVGRRSKVSRRSDVYSLGAKSRREVLILTTNFSVRPNSTVFSPDSKLLAFVDNFEGVRLWDLVTRQEITNFPAYFQYIGSLGIAFSPDGQTLAYNENKAGDIVLCDIRTRSLLKHLKGHTRFVTSLAFTPDSKVLVSGSMDKTVKLWDVAEGREQRTFNYTAGVDGFRLSPDGKVLAISASAGGQRMTIQEMSTGREIMQLRGHQKAVTDAAFSSDGKVITGSEDETVRVWELAPAARKDVFALTGLSPNWAGAGTAVCFSPDAENLLTVFTDRTFSIWATRTLVESKHYPVPVAQFACAGLASGGKLAAFVDVDGNVVLWNGGTGETNSFGRPTTKASTRAVFSRDGKRLAIGGIREVSVLDISRQEKLRSFSIQDGESSRPDDIVMSLAFSQNGQIVMAGFYDGLVKLWDLSRPFQLALKGGNDQVHGLALLSDMRTLVSVSREVRFWDLNSRQHPLVLQEPRVRGWGCSVSPDGRRLATVGSNGLITIWDLASRQILVALEGHESFALDIAFLGDGDTLVSVGDDQVRIWRAASFAEADALKHSQ